MPETALVNGSTQVRPESLNGHIPVADFGPLFAPDRIQKLIAALEEPFDPAEIKWRVTNTSQVGSRNGPRLRGQMLAYADPRAYTDRLNELFTPSGWTRDYAVQLVQNFERKERGSAERTIAAKIVVTCKVTVYGFATHTGLGEEWADNDNAGTAAEAQAFKRACSCFGLGRYLYDLEGQWVDLDRAKRPLETPRLPDWALPHAQRVAKQGGSASRRDASLPPKQNGKGTGKKDRDGLYRVELLGQVKAVCAAVGFSLARSVLRAVADVDDPTKIRDMAKLTMVLEKLQDLARGVERLNASFAKIGKDRYSSLCREMGLASDSIDDIPDRETLRRLLQTLKAELGWDQTKTAKDNRSVDAHARAQDGSDLSTLRGRLLREAARVTGATNRTLGDVIQEAATGAFNLATLKALGAADIGKVEAALHKLEQMAVGK